MFDRQTKKFCAAVIEALPDVSARVMQGWIDNPRALKLTLDGALCPPDEAETASVETPPKFNYIAEVLRERFAGADASKGQVLQPQTLPRAMKLAEIKQALKPSIVTVDDILATIRSGVLRRDGSGELFFLEDWAVLVFWFVDGWFVYAHSVENPYGWRGGVRIFSRSSGSTVPA